MLLVLVLFASMMWVSRETEAATDEAMVQIYQFHQSHPPGGSKADSDADTLTFLERQAEQIRSTNALYTIVSFGLFVLSITILLNNYRYTRRLGRKLSAVERSATTDPLTAVKNRVSYAQYELALKASLRDGSD